MATGKATKAPHKTDTSKLLRTETNRVRRSAAVAARKARKPQPVPQAGRATRRVGKPRKAEAGKKP